MNEQEMREAEVPTIDTAAELASYIRGLTDQEHDYGTCVYAMSMAAVAAFNHVAHKLGVTGFQAGCADMDILARTRGMKHGFFLRDNADLLYPQYRHKYEGLDFDSQIEKNAEWLAEEAAKHLSELEDGMAADAVVEHWQMLAALKKGDV